MAISSSSSASKKLLNLSTNGLQALIRSHVIRPSTAAAISTHLIASKPLDQIQIERKSFDSMLKAVGLNLQMPVEFAAKKKPIVEPEDNDVDEDDDDDVDSDPEISDEDDDDDDEVDISDSEFECSGSESD